MHAYHPGGLRLVRLWEAVGQMLEKKQQPETVSRVCRPCHPGASLCPAGPIRSTLSLPGQLASPSSCPQGGPDCLQGGNRAACSRPTGDTEASPGEGNSLVPLRLPAPEEPPSCGRALCNIEGGAGGPWGTSEARRQTQGVDAAATPGSPRPAPGPDRAGNCHQPPPFQEMSMVALGSWPHPGIFSLTGP